MLKYEDGPVADLLRSIKRNFGTEGDSGKGEQSPGVSAGDRRVGDGAGVRSGDYRGNNDHDGRGLASGQRNAGDGSQEGGWLRLAVYSSDGGLVVPRLPTTEELTRWPREMVRRFYRALDALLQNNPLLIDPNALERHHGLPRAFINYFLDCGLEIEKFIIIMRLADHRLKPDGVHTGKGKGGRWNEEWKQFMEAYPAKNTMEHQRRVEDKLKEMKKRYGIP